MPLKSPVPAPAGTVTDRRYFRIWIHRLADALEQAVFFQLVNKIPEVAVFHGYDYA